MPLKFSLEGTEARLIASFESLSSRFLEALAKKMTIVMEKLQEKAQARAPRISGKLQASIRNPRSEIAGTTILGTLEWGGSETTTADGSDYSQIVERGAKPHVINPLTTKGTRSHEKGAKRRFGKDHLAFYSERLGKAVFADYVFHPGVTGSHFMADSIQEMKEVMIQEFTETFQEVKQEMSSKRLN